jgi:hypothetical protein
MTPEQITSFLAAFADATGPTVLAIILYMLVRGELVTKGHLNDVKEAYEARIERLQNGKS